MSNSSPTRVTPQAKLPLWRQLRWNLTFYFVLLAVIPLSIVQYFTLSRISAESQKQVFQQLESVSGLKQYEIQQWIIESHRVLRLFLAPSTEQPMIQMLHSPTGDNQQLVDQILVNGLQSADQSSTATSATSTTSTNASIAKLFDRFFVYDTNGTILAGSDQTDLGKLVNRQPYFKDSFSGTYTQPPYYALNTGKLTIVLTEPVRDQNGVLGILAGEVNMTILSDIMAERSGLGNTGETYLVSNENNYLLTPSRFDGFVLDKAYHSQGIDNALKQQSGSGLYTGYRGVSVLGYYRWIPELQAGLLAEEEESEALAATTSVLTTGVLVDLGMALVAAVLGLLIISQISSPLRKLTEVTTQITNGNLNLHVNVKQRNEFGLLADTFNKMTDQLRHNIRELDARIEELAHTNTELKIATAQAREASRIKGEFLANMSHELRTPLNAIIGFSDMLLAGMSGVLNDKQRHKMERLRENGIRLLTLINDLLDLTRIEAGRLEIVQNAFAPRELVERIAAQMESLATQSNLAFNVHIAPNVPMTLKGDEKRVEQVLVNLISNAFKFTKEGSITLNMSADPAENTWTFDVIDTGIGIPPHALNLIFEEFRQLDGSYSRAYKGSGLGLAITRNLVRMMGGKILVKSTLGAGSTFTVILPMTLDIPEAVLEGIAR